MNEKHPSIFLCHERPLIINYHVLVGQYEISGSQITINLNHLWFTKRWPELFSISFFSQLYYLKIY